jgi:soluble lytic murein transglycosylase-like protein
LRVLEMKVSDILAQKIAEIESRLPVRFKKSSQSSFQSLLESSLGSEAAKTAPLIDAAQLESPQKTSGTKYPLVSGSYESVYPRLSQAEIQELMPRIDAAIEKYSEQFSVDPVLIRAVMKVESSFQPFALSTSGAMGLMQLMPFTAEGLGVSDPYNIEENIRGGVQYLHYQLKEFDDDWKLALAAYNAGPNAVKKYGGIPPYEQTQKYVELVLKYYDMYKALK